MLLAVDVGNTNMEFGIFQGSELIGSFRLMTDANRTSDEIGLTVCEYFRRFDLRAKDIEDVIIASVVPR
jgi:type III pantothenate kinase